MPNCRYCNRAIGWDDSFCPHCGRFLQPAVAVAKEPIADDGRVWRYLAISGLLLPLAPVIFASEIGIPQSEVGILVWFAYIVGLVACVPWATMQLASCKTVTRYGIACLLPLILFVHICVLFTVLFAITSVATSSV